ncbi:MAG TPA: hypothetical protein VMV54_09570, partial [Acidocella sp.]|nr:hypothetical protein [Acidocella sp.]
ERVDQERGNLQERINQERDGLKERLKEALKADEERIIGMRAALVERQALEDADRALRLTRMQEDHDAQLLAMAAAQKDRIKQINQGAIDERNAQWDGLLARLDDLGLHNDAWLALQQDRQKASLDFFDTYWKAFQARMSAPSSVGGGTTGTGTTARPPIVRGYQDPRTGAWGTPMLTRQAGGPVFDTAATMLHGSRSRPEYVLSADTTALLRGALGGAFSQQQLVGAVAGGGGGVTVQSGGIPIVIHAAPAKACRTWGERSGR